MEFYQVIKDRRSVRKYSDKKIDDAVLKRLWEAVNLAPTACNRQPFQFLLVQSEPKRKLVCESYPQPWLAQAPVTVVALGNRETAWKRMNGVSAHTIDVSIAMEHLVLAAAAEGLGTCWICAFDQDKLHNALQLSPEWEVVAITPLGYPGETPAAKPRKPLNEVFKVI